MSFIASEQGREGLSLPSPINMDWQHPDLNDAPHPVFLLVHPPPPAQPRCSPRDLHWALAWQPRYDSSASTPFGFTRGPWRRIELDTYDVRTDPAPQPRYVFWGARTASADPDPTHDAGVARIPLVRLVCAQRRRVEELAWEVPVMVPDGVWNGQDWIRALLECMVVEGLVAREAVDVMLAQAEMGKHALVADVTALVEALDLKAAVHIGHSTGGGEVVRYVAQAKPGRVSKAVIIGAVPPIMLQTKNNPGGLPLEVFDGFRDSMIKDRAQFFIDVPSGPFFGFNREQAKDKVSQGLIWNWYRQGMMCGFKGAYDCIKVFSE